MFKQVSILAGGALAFCTEDLLSGGFQGCKEKYHKCYTVLDYFGPAERLYDPRDLR
jgi:hypothetical protein